MKDTGIIVDLKGATPFYTEKQFAGAATDALAAFDTLVSGKGRGSEYLGWLNLPSKMDRSLLSQIISVAESWREKADVVIVIGIGGSYLGAKAAIEALSHSFGIKKGEKKYPDVVFAGQNLSGEYMADLMDLISEKESASVVISKSGTTTEPAIAFRIIKDFYETRYGKAEATNRIVAVTDSKAGALKSLSLTEGYRTFIIPDDVGGRYSVLTPVGLLPFAIAGFDIEALIDGAVGMEQICNTRTVENPAIRYASVRNLLYNNGVKIEILVNFHPKLTYFSEWWKQLFGESEGKEGRGLFPASVNFTSDLHSMGQYIQDGERILFETVLSVRESSRDIAVNKDDRDLDGLNFIAGRTVEECNKMAELGTRIAHIDGGVPNVLISVEKLNEYNLGSLFYFFEFACGISAYMLGINPFDQPGVEDYKRNMFALLGKPGYDELAQKLKERF
jgi:glucose-6-phosphate isomerase